MVLQSIFLPWGMLKKINKIEADLIRSDVSVSGFAGESIKLEVLYLWN